MNRASQKNLLLVLFGIILVVLLFWFIKLFKDSSDARKALNEARASNTPSPNNKALPTPTNTPIIPPTPTPLSDEEKVLQDQLVKRYLPQCPDKIYALVKAEFGNSLTMYEIEGAEIKLNISNTTSPADQKNGERIFSGNINLKEGTERAVYRTSEEGSPVTSLIFKAGTFVNGIPFNGYFKVRSVNGKWAFENEKFQKLTCKEVDYVLKADERIQQEKIEVERLRESLLASATNFMNKYFIKCRGWYYAKQKDYPSNNNPTAYIIYEVRNINVNLPEVLTSKDSESSVNIGLTGYVRYQHQKTGTAIDPVGRDYGYFVAFQRRGQTWQVKDNLLEEISSCLDIPKMKNETILIDEERRNQ